MAPLSKNVKIILAVLVVGVLGFLAYSFLNKAPEAAVTTQGGLSSEGVQESGAVGQRLMATLETIRTLKLDKSIVASPAFTSLKDFSTEISPLPVGRDNPFAPPGVTASPRSTPVTPRR